MIQAAEVEQGFEGRAPLQAEGQERRGTAGVGAYCGPSEKAGCSEEGGNGAGCKKRPRRRCGVGISTVWKLGAQGVWA